MRTFDRVNVVIKANIYFNGNVTSRTLEFEDGARKTLGIMLPGDFEFKTGSPEIMEITSGLVEVQLSGSDEWKQYPGGTSFEVAGNSSFRIKVLEVTDYICSFV